MLTFNPIRTALVLGVEVFEGLLHLIDFNPAADELWDWRYAERLAEHEAEQEVSEPQSSSSAARSRAGTADGERPEPPSPPPDVEAPGIQLTRDDLLRASVAARSHAVHYSYSEQHAATYRTLADKLHSASRETPCPTSA